MRAWHPAAVPGAGCCPRPQDTGRVMHWLARMEPWLAVVLPGGQATQAAATPYVPAGHGVQAARPVVLV